MADIRKKRADKKSTRETKKAAKGEATEQETTNQGAEEPENAQSAASDNGSTSSTGSTSEGSLHLLATAEEGSILERISRRKASAGTESKTKEKGVLKPLFTLPAWQKSFTTPEVNSEEEELLRDIIAPAPANRFCRRTSRRQLIQAPERNGLKV